MTKTITHFFSHNISRNKGGVVFNFQHPSKANIAHEILMLHYVQEDYEILFRGKSWLHLRTFTRIKFHVRRQ